MSGADDKPLIHDLAAGQEAAFAAHYDRFAAQLYRVALAILIAGSKPAPGDASREPLPPSPIRPFHSSMFHPRILLLPCPIRSIRAIRGFPLFPCSEFFCPQFFCPSSHEKVIQLNP
jgi:hypothetical protein